MHLLDKVVKYRSPSEMMIGKQGPLKEVTQLIVKQCMILVSSLKYQHNRSLKQWS